MTRTISEPEGTLSTIGLTRNVVWGSGGAEANPCGCRWSFRRGGMAAAPPEEVDGC